MTEADEYNLLIEKIQPWLWGNIKKARLDRNPIPDLTNEQKEYIKTLNFGEAFIEGRASPEDLQGFQKAVTQETQYLYTIINKVNTKLARVLGKE